MHTKDKFQLDYSYLALPDKFYQNIRPEIPEKPEILLLNDRLCEDLEVENITPEYLIDLLYSNKHQEETQPFAQAYAGHQFGHFTRLGDGRAIIMGEHVKSDHQRFDIQLKGSGRTQYSRNGDGKATLKAMLREYFMSEAMYHLGIPTSQSLVLIKTGDTIIRERLKEGAAVIRVMKSHIRIGTFEYASYFGSTEDLEKLLNYTLERLYPELSQTENKALALINKVIAVQIDLIVHWMRVGFIHGVMNTDNVVISGETFDYGPCAFMNVYNPETVYSSIDEQGRYAFGNQPNIIKWNIARLAEALLPLIDKDKNKAIEMAQKSLDDFDVMWGQKFQKAMLHKIGLDSSEGFVFSIVGELLAIMRNNKLDYTHTFYSLAQELHAEGELTKIPELKTWLDKWKQAIKAAGNEGLALERMSKANPVYIPRNHWVEKALDEAEKGNMNLFHEFLNVLKKPYELQTGAEKFREVPNEMFEAQYQTFCGT